METTAQRETAPGRTRDLSKTVMPPENPSELLELDSYLTQTPSLTDGKGNSIPLPSEIYDVLRTTVEAMQAGRAIVIRPTSIRLTTGEAAEYLEMSRPTLVKLLEAGEIPYEKPNRHRYVQLTDLEEYRTKKQVERQEILDAMSRDAAELDLDDISGEEAVAAIKASRKESGE